MKNFNPDIFVKSFLIEEFLDVEISIFGKLYQYKMSNIGKHNILNSVLAIGCIIANGFKPEQFLHLAQNIRNP